MALSNHSSGDDRIRVVLGTYTRSESQGVYEVILNRTTGQLETEKANLIIPALNPTYVVTTPEGYLCAGIREELPSGQKLAGIALYRFDTESNSWKELSRCMNTGASTCHIYIDSVHDHIIYGSSYHDGTLRSYQYDPDTGVIRLLQEIVRERPSDRSFPHENQNCNHVHYAQLTPDNNYLSICDLGADAVIFYKIVSTSGQLALDNSNDTTTTIMTENSPVRLTEHSLQYLRHGAGPRHMIFHPNGLYAYVVGELDCTLNIIAFNPTDGSTRFVQRISTLPDDFIEWNSCAAIRLSPDNKYVYISNRGHNSIAVFELTPDGNRASLVQIAPTQHLIPRDFNIDPSGQFLIAGHQEDHYLTLFRRQEETGQLSIIQDHVFAPECVCVTFGDRVQ